MGARVRVLAVGLDPGELPGCRVEAAEDLLGALARLADGGVDLVLLSLDLPDGQGPDLVRAVRGRSPEVPVIALAATDHEGSRALDAGALDALPADAEPGLLLRAIRSATAIARLEAELERARVLDELTGLLNANGLGLIAEHHLRMADRSQVPVRLVLVRLEVPGGADDLDADRRRAFVAETAEVLRGFVREADLLARVDEGTFCVLLTGDATGAEALVLSRLVEAVAARNARAGGRGEIRLAVGAATYEPGRRAGFAQLMADAERRMGRPS
ncbi:MAG TPA: response regulator [Actinomycetota bacterium]